MQLLRKLAGVVGCGPVSFLSLATGRKKRIHFHDFMLDSHLQKHKGVPDPLEFVAGEISDESILLCLDEFMVADVADALILNRLFGHLFSNGVILVATSNRAPDNLYEGGLQRDLFLPFISTLKERCVFLEIGSSTDYRKMTSYHVARLKLDREALQSTVPYESKFDTLLPHHPLVVTTTLHHSNRASINGVKVTYWDIYNDRHVIIHGVEDFFDPAFQTLLYPWYDGMVTKNENDSRIGKDSNTELGKLSWVKEMMMMEQRFLLVMAVFVLAGSCLSLACLRLWNHQDGGYAYSKPDDGVLV
ncbi:AFG1-like ATPase [Camellia lanceoleosa]|uniref:AFG1-like ATPase n=1 Tax=Camellia lanceoleosa TaxID=1840588 RepID=A0ACC0H4E9_9ERIC|nr:AFG1-like ATPase [Camellia lanceoleosa]